MRHTAIERTKNTRPEDGTRSDAKARQGYISDPHEEASDRGGKHGLHEQDARDSLPQEAVRPKHA